MNKSNKNYSKKRISRLILIVLLVFMVTSNPSKNDFYEWANNEAIENSGSVLEGALTNLFVSPLLKSITVRKDYFFFSTYTIEIDQDKTVYLGIFKRFIKIKSD